jgi:hypothetical protein
MVAARRQTPYLGKIVRHHNPDHIPKQLLTAIQLVADISATSPHHFLVICHKFAIFWRKIKVDSVLETGESFAPI